jgi:hypothetical protein
VAAAVNDGFLPPATIDPPPTPEDDVLTPEQDTLLRQVHFWIANNYVPGATVTALDPRFNALADKLDKIDARLGALEAGEVSSADDIVLAAARRITNGAQP